MKFLSVLLFFVKGFMTRFTTVVYPKVYSPSSALTSKNPTDMELASLILLLCHEGQHMFDRKSWWWFFNLIYLGPQLLALIAILAIFSPWFLLALVFLAPIPSIGRAAIEIRGYTVSLAAGYWMGVNVDVPKIVDNFCGANYYFMFPFRGYLTRKFGDVVRALREGGKLPGYVDKYRPLFYPENLSSVDSNVII
jgi:hypothetical protein